MDESVFTDNCYDSLHDADYEEYATPHDCHLVSGWTTGKDTCPLWEQIIELCQTEPEKRFLKRYLQFVKDRQFPMLIPQTGIGITERRRPDFVAFVPLQYWKYKWVAIQLDAAHKEEQLVSDSVRDEYVREHKYDVVSLRPEQTGYFEEVRKLVEEFESWMSLADTDPWSIVVDAEVRKSVAVDDIPFGRGSQRPKQKTGSKTDHEDPRAVAVFRDNIWTPLGGHESNRRRRHTGPLRGCDLSRFTDTPEKRLAMFQRSGGSEIREHDIGVAKSQRIGWATDLALNTAGR